MPILKIRRLFCPKFVIIWIIDFIRHWRKPRKIVPTLQEFFSIWEKLRPLFLWKPFVLPVPIFYRKYWYRELSAVYDSKLLKKSLEANRRIIHEADSKIEKATSAIKQASKYPQEGLSFPAHLAGLFGQRLWFYHKTTGYSKKLKISDDCTGCGLCASICPMGNLRIQNGKAVNLEKCTMCYRCISSCPQKAITLLGKEVIEQCRYEKYV